MTATITRLLGLQVSSPSTDKNVAVSKTPWTPGPWFVEPHQPKPHEPVRIYHDEGIACIAEAFLGCAGPDGSEASPANGRLIAAAPDLYAALSDVLPILRGLLGQLAEDEIATLEKARAALTKADGDA